MSQQHLAFIRTLPCAVCGERWASWPVEAHHLLKPGDATERGIGRKAADKYAVPLCRSGLTTMGCHEALHMNGDEEAYLASKGIDGRSLARQLWANTGNFEACLTILWKARNHG